MSRFKVQLNGKKPKGVYGIILNLLVKGKRAALLNADGRYILHWPKAMKCYLKFRKKKNLRNREKIEGRDANNCFRSALLLKSYVEEGACEYYKASSTVGKKGRYKKENVWREFQLPSRFLDAISITENVSDGIMDYEDDMSVCGNSQHGLLMDSNSVVELDNTVGRENPQEEGATCDPVPGPYMDGSDQNHHVSWHGLLMDSNSDGELVNTVGKENPQEEEPIYNPPHGSIVDCRRTGEDVPSSSGGGATCDPVAGPYMDGSDQNHHVSGHGLSMDSNSDVELVNTVGKENPKKEPINPSYGSFLGGYPFVFKVTKKMSDYVTSPKVQFHDVIVDVKKLDDSLVGIVPFSCVVGVVEATAFNTNQLTGASEVLGVAKFEYIIDLPQLVKNIVLATGLNQFQAFEWLVRLLRENGVVLGSDREVEHLDTLNVEKQGQSLNALELQVSTYVKKHPQKFINLLVNTLEGQKIISSCMSGGPSEGVGRAKVPQETEAPHSGLEALTVTTQMSSLNISNQTATREGGQCAQTEAIARQVQGDDITSVFLPIAYAPIKPSPASNADDVFSSGTTASVSAAFGGPMEDKAALRGDSKVRGGRVLGKSVMVLKSRDVCIKGDTVFMPNIMERARLRKPEKGQFKRDVKILPEMSKTDVKEMLIAIFPYLEHQRFYCASLDDNRTRLEFHGEHRIWDGNFIRRKILGNSCLYIYSEEDPTLEKPYEQMQIADVSDTDNGSSSGYSTEDETSICSPAVVVIPSCGSLEGGYRFSISFPEELPLEFETLLVRFEGLGDVNVNRLNPQTLCGVVPPSSVPRDVPVTVITGGDRKLGMTFFRYCGREKTMNQIVLSDPDKIEDTDHGSSSGYFSETETSSRLSGGEDESQKGAFKESFSLAELGTIFEQLLSDDEEY